MTKQEYMKQWRAQHPTYQKEWRAKNPDYWGRWLSTKPGYFYTERRVAWRKAYRDTQRDHDYKRLYGITLDEYKALLERQDGRCAICRTDKPGGARCKNFQVDHEHHSGRVRGLLCVAYNVHLGWLERRRVAVEGYLK